MPYESMTRKYIPIGEWGLFDLEIPRKIGLQLLWNEEDRGTPIVGLLVGRVDHGDLAIVASGRKAIESHVEAERSYAKPI